MQQVLSPYSILLPLRIKFIYLIWNVTHNTYTLDFLLNFNTASRILDNMDTTVSPCDDFYEFACGGWQKNKYISDDQTGITEFGALREDLNRKLRGLRISDVYTDCH